jgi:acylphosphatase
MTRLQIRYTGHVQGVGFRATFAQAAEGFDVTGFVRNDPDGAVTAEVQGQPDALAELLAIVRERMSVNIKSETQSPMAARTDERTFAIRR